MRKRSKGFTLIELLAVIVILAVIALIATPTILGMIDRARESAAKSDMLAYVKEIERQVLASSIDDPNGTIVSGEGFTIFNEGKSIKKGTSEINLEIKGTKPVAEGSTVSINSTGEVTSADLKFGKYYVHYEVKDNGDAETCTDKSEFKTCDGKKIENTPYTAYSTGKTSEVSVIYFNPVENKKCNLSEVNSETGTKTGCMKWYAIENSDENKSTVKVILDHNTTALVTWNSDNDNTIIKEVQAALDSDTSTWANGLSPRLITAKEVADIVGKTNWNSSTATENDWFYFQDDENGSACKTSGCDYAWLYDRASTNCEYYGCLNNASGTNIGGMEGYWTSTPVSLSSEKAWGIYSEGYFDPCDADSAVMYGVRPVITINKNVLN